MEGVVEDAVGMVVVVDAGDVVVDGEGAVVGMAVVVGMAAAAGMVAEDMVVVEIAGKVPPHDLPAGGVSLGSTRIVGFF
jgi:4-hydroxybenzoate polyprenyltransferase